MSDIGDAGAQPGAPAQLSGNMPRRVQHLADVPCRFVQRFAETSRAYANKSKRLAVVAETVLQGGQAHGALPTAAQLAAAPAAILALQQLTLGLLVNVP